MKQYNYDVAMGKTLKRNSGKNVLVECVSYVENQNFVHTISQVSLYFDTAFNLVDMPEQKNVKLPKKDESRNVFHI